MELQMTVTPARRGRPARKARVAKTELKDPQDLKVRVEKLENKALQENQALQDLLAQMASVVASAKLHWYQKTTTLKWMIAILALIVLDRLVSLSPSIVPMVMKLL
jgi:hypothetical protein